MLQPRRIFILFGPSWKTTKKFNDSKFSNIGSTGLDFQDNFWEIMIPFNSNPEGP